MPFVEESAGVILCHNGAHPRMTEFLVEEAPTDDGTATGGWWVWLPCVFGRPDLATATEAEGPAAWLTHVEKLSDEEVRAVAAARRTGHWLAPMATLADPSRVGHRTEPYAWPTKIAALLAKSRWKAQSQKAGLI